MTTTTAKAIELAQYIREELAIRLGLAAVLSFDTDKNPLVRVGDGVANHAGALVKVMPIEWAAKDILGLDSQVYTPHKIMVAFEAAKAGAGADVDPNTWQQKLSVLGAALKKNCLVELYESAADTAPVSGTFIAGNLQASFEASLKYPMVSSQ